MVKIQVSDASLFALQVDGYAFFMADDTPPSEAVARFPSLPALFKERAFTGKQGSSVVVPVCVDDKLIHLIFVGLGTKNDVEYYRRAVGRLIRIAEGHKLKKIACELVDAGRYATDDVYLAQQFSVAAHIADYHFDTFKKEKVSTIQREMTLVTSQARKKQVQKGVEIGALVAQAVNKTRHLVDMPPSQMTPTILAEHAKQVAKEAGVKITVFTEAQVISMGMGGLAAVAAGSEQDAQFIAMEYNCGNSAAPTIALVGKGITFDSGGLSIKPANSMETMKEDMAGAAAVICAIGALAQLKAPVNIVALAPTTENLPSGTATKPGDIITFYNGKTAEVRNTDAEGRLILADALSYALATYKPQYIIDLATLTGACDYACGPFYAGMLSQHDPFAEKVMQAGIRAGDYVWRLPMHDDYAQAVTSSVADICNIGKSNYKAGTITAAFFLKEFVDEKTPWVHVDIASVAFDMPDRSYFESGATGAGVRLLIELVMNGAL